MIDKEASLASEPALLSPKDRLITQIGQWQRKVDTVEWKNFRAARLAWALAENFEKDAGLVKCPPEEVVLPTELERPQELVVSFLELYDAYQSLIQVEYYFRRYPFRDLPVSRRDHFRNVCDMYFNCFYIVYTRLKQCMTALKQACPDMTINEAGIPKKFYESFREEINQRNENHHRVSFQDGAIDKIYLKSVFEDEASEAAIFRAECKRWIGFVKRVTPKVETYIDLVARCILEFAAYLKV